MSTQRRVLIAVSLDGDGIARFPRLFAGSGAKVDVICPHGYSIVRSRYVDRHISAPADPAAIARVLRNVVESDDYATVILGCDPLIYEVYRLPDSRWLARYLPVDPRRYSQRVSSKNEFLRACSDAGIPVPPFHICDSEQRAVVAAERLGYPVMLKLAQGYSGIGVRKFVDETALHDAFARGFAQGTFVIQRCVDGTPGTTAALFRDGAPLLTTSAYYERCWPTPFHPPTVRRLTTAPAFANLAARVGAMMEYNGFGGIDWIEDRASGKIYVLELNARPMPMHVIAPSLANYVRAVRAFLDGGAPAGLTAFRENCRYRVFPNDLHRILAERDFAGVLRWMFAEPFRGAIPFDDPGLLLAQMARTKAFYARTIAGYGAAAAGRLRAKFSI